MKISSRMAAATPLLTGAVVLLGCTVTTVRPTVAHREEAKTYSTVAVGEITGTDELWHNYG